MHEEKDDKNKSAHDTEYIAEDSGDFQDEDGEGATPEQKMKKLRERITRLQKEKEEYLDGWQRERAAFANFQKDEVKRGQEMRATATQDILHGVIDILDSFVLAHLQAPENIQKDVWFEGMPHMEHQLKQILSRYGVQEIEVTEGDAFDPAYHEALGQEEAKDTKNGTILEVFQKGYKMGTRIIRPTRVKIAK